MPLLYFSIDLNLKSEAGSAFTSRTNPWTQNEIQSRGITFFSRCSAEAINTVSSWRSFIGLLSKPCVWSKYILQSLCVFFRHN